MKRRQLPIGIVFRVGAWQLSSMTFFGDTANRESRNRCFSTFPQADGLRLKSTSGSVCRQSASSRNLLGRVNRSSRMYWVAEAACTLRMACTSVGGLWRRFASPSPTVAVGSGAERDQAKISATGTWATERRRNGDAASCAPVGLISAPQELASSPLQTSARRYSSNGIVRMDYKLLGGFKRKYPPRAIETRAAILLL